MLKIKWNDEKLLTINKKSYIKTIYLINIYNYVKKNRNLKGKY